MRTLSLVLGLSLALGCGRGRRAAPACDHGAPGFTAYPAACTHADCRACVTELSALWARRAEAPARAAFRQRFMRASADARDEFARAQRPDGAYPLEHCTAGLAPGSSCATYSPYCVTVLSDALRSGDTPMRWRVQLDVAVGKSCDRSRDEILQRLRTCAPFADTAACESAACTTCLAGHIAALTVLAPVIDNPDRLEQFVALVDATPELLARATVDALGAPDPPADVEPQVAQRAVRHHCMSLLRRSATPPPMACDARLASLLREPTYADFARAWSAMETARPEVRGATLDALLRGVAQGRALPDDLRAHLRALPAPERAGALRRVLARPVDPAVLAALREELRVAAPDEPLPAPPTSAPSTPAPAAAPSPAGGGLGIPAVHLPASAT
ncbi:MAG: hypothetical protein U0325_35515 [Polyangiales bacterium]